MNALDQIKSMLHREIVDIKDFRDLGNVEDLQQLKSEASHIFTLSISLIDLINNDADLLAETSSYCRNFYKAVDLLTTHFNNLGRLDAENYIYNNSDAIIEALIYNITNDFDPLELIRSYIENYLDNDQLGTKQLFKIAELVQADLERVNLPLLERTTDTHVELYTHYIDTTSYQIDINDLKNDDYLEDNISQDLFSRAIRFIAAYNLSDYPIAITSDTIDIHVDIDTTYSICIEIDDLNSLTKAAIASFI